jgi:hypothetical protein
MFLIAYLLDPSEMIHIFCCICNELTPAAVYYRDGALRLALPPRPQFSKKTASALVIQIIESARRMLQFEQQRVRQGRVDDGDKLVKELTGESSFGF